MANRKFSIEHEHISIRLPKADLDAMRDRAEENDRSVSAEFRRALRLYLMTQAATAESKAA